MFAESILSIRGKNDEQKFILLSSIRKALWVAKHQLESKIIFKEHVSALVNTLHVLLVSNDLSDNNLGFFFSVFLFDYIKAVRHLPDDYSQKVAHCMNQNDSSLVKNAARFGAHMVLKGFIKSDFIEGVIKTSIKNLSSEDPNQQYNGILVLREIAFTIPNYFFQYIQPFFDKVFFCLKDSRTHVRKAVVDTIRAGIVVIAQRTTNEKNVSFDWHEFLFERTLKVLRDVINTNDLYHSSASNTAVQNQSNIANQNSFKSKANSSGTGGVTSSSFSQPFYRVEDAQHSVIMLFYEFVRLCSLDLEVRKEKIISIFYSNPLASPIPTTIDKSSYEIEYNRLQYFLSTIFENTNLTRYSSNSTTNFDRFELVELPDYYQEQHSKISVIGCFNDKINEIILSRIEEILNVCANASMKTNNVDILTSICQIIPHLVYIHPSLINRGPFKNLIVMIHSHLDNAKLRPHILLCDSLMTYLLKDKYIKHCKISYVMIKMSIKQQNDSKKKSISIDPDVAIFLTMTMFIMGPSFFIFMGSELIELLFSPRVKMDYCLASIFSEITFLDSPIASQFSQNIIDHIYRILSKQPSLNINRNIQLPALVTGPTALSSHNVPVNYQRQKSNVSQYSALLLNLNDKSSNKSNNANFSEKNQSSTTSSNPKKNNSNLNINKNITAPILNNQKILHTSDITKYSSNNYQQPKNKVQNQNSVCSNEYHTGSVYYHYDAQKQARLESYFYKILNDYMFFYDDTKTWIVSLLLIRATNLDSNDVQELTSVITDNYLNIDSVVFRIEAVKTALYLLEKLVQEKLKHVVFYPTQSFHAEWTSMYDLGNLNSDHSRLNQDKIFNRIKNAKLESKFQVMDPIMRNTYRIDTKVNSFNYHYNLNTYKINDRVRSILSRIISVAISDSDFNVRVVSLNRLNYKFDSFLVLPDNTQYLIIALRDENQKVQLETISLIGRLCILEPCFTLPILAKFLHDITSQFKLTHRFQPVTNIIERNLVLLGKIMISSERVARECMIPLINTVLPILTNKNYSPKVIDNSLYIVGNLARICYINLGDYLKKFVELVCNLLTDSTMLINRSASLKCIVDILETNMHNFDTCFSIEGLMDILLNLIKNEPKRNVRCLIIKIIGMLGAVDPSRMRLFYSKTFSENSTINSKNFIDPNTDSDILSAELFIDLNSNDLSVFYPAIAIETLLKVLTDANQSHNYNFALHGLEQIFISLGPKCVTYLSKIIPIYLRLIRESGMELQLMILQQIGKIVALVRSSIQPYLEDLFDVLREFWIKDATFIWQIALLKLLEGLIIAIPDESKSHIHTVLPQIISILNNEPLLLASVDRNQQYILISRVMASLMKHCYYFDGYYHILVPAVINTFDSSSNTLEIKKMGMETLCVMSHTVSIREFSSSIMQAVLRVMDSNVAIIEDCIKLLMVMAIHLGQIILSYSYSIKTILKKHNIKSQKFDSMLNILKTNQFFVLSYDFLEYYKPDLAASRILKSINNDFANNATTANKTSGELTNSALKNVGKVGKSMDSYYETTKVTNISFTMDTDMLRESCLVNNKISHEDWMEWLEKLTYQLIRNSPRFSIRVCLELSQKLSTVTKDLFYAAFVSCWQELNSDIKASFRFSLITALKDRHSTGITLVLLNLIEFMDHIGLKIDITPDVLFQASMKINSYTKALYYAEILFRENPKSMENIYSLISINSKLQNMDAAYGALNSAKKIKKSLSFNRKVSRNSKIMDGKFINYNFQDYNNQYHTNHAVPNETLTYCDPLVSTYTAAAAVGSAIVTNKDSLHLNNDYFRNNSNLKKTGINFFHNNNDHFSYNTQTKHILSFSKRPKHPSLINYMDHFDSAISNNSYTNGLTINNEKCSAASLMNDPSKFNLNEYRKVTGIKNNVETLLNRNVFLPENLDYIEDNMNNFISKNVSKFNSKGYAVEENADIQLVYIPHEHYYNKEITDSNLYESEKQFDIPENWYEELHDWKGALHSYNSKLRENPYSIKLLHGKMKCLEGLGRWNELLNLLDNMHVKSKSTKDNESNKNAIFDKNYQMNANVSLDEIYAQKSKNFTAVDSFYNNNNNSPTNSLNLKVDTLPSNYNMLTDNINIYEDIYSFNNIMYDPKIKLIKETTGLFKEPVSDTIFKAKIGAAAAFGLGDIETIAKKFVNNIPHDTVVGSFYRAVIEIKYNNLSFASKLIENARTLLDNEFSMFIGDSYERFFPHILYSQELNELDEIIKFSRSVHLRPVINMNWNKRLEYSKPNIKYWQRILLIRSIVSSASDNWQPWLKYANLCRKSNRIHFSYKIFSFLIDSNLFDTHLPNSDDSNANNNNKKCIQNNPLVASASAPTHNEKKIDENKSFINNRSYKFNYNVNDNDSNDSDNQNIDMTQAKKFEKNYLRVPKSSNDESLLKCSNSQSEPKSFTDSVNTVCSNITQSNSIINISNSSYFNDYDQSTEHSAAYLDKEFVKKIDNSSKTMFIEENQVNIKTLSNGDNSFEKKKNINSVFNLDGQFLNEIFSEQTGEDFQKFGIVKIFKNINTFSNVHPQIIYSYLKFIWHIGSRVEAYELMNSFVTKMIAKIKLNHNNDSLAIMGSVDFDKLIAKSYMKLGHWKFSLQNEEFSRNNITDILQHYFSATEHASNWSKTWHSWAIMNYNVVLYYKHRGIHVGPFNQELTSIINDEMSDVDPNLLMRCHRHNLGATSNNAISNNNRNTVSVKGCVRCKKRASKKNFNKNFGIKKSPLSGQPNNNKVPISGSNYNESSLKFKHRYVDANLAGLNNQQHICSETGSDSEIESRHYEINKSSPNSTTNNAKYEFCKNQIQDQPLFSNLIDKQSKYFDMNVYSEADTQIENNFQDSIKSTSFASSGIFDFDESCGNVKEYEIKSYDKLSTENDRANGDLSSESRKTNREDKKAVRNNKFIVFPLSKNIKKCSAKLKNKTSAQKMPKTSPTPTKSSLNNSVNNVDDYNDKLRVDTHLKLPKSLNKKNCNMSNHINTRLDVSDINSSFGSLNSSSILVDRSDKSRIDNFTEIVNDDNNKDQTGNYDMSKVVTLDSEYNSINDGDDTFEDEDVLIDFNDVITEDEVSELYVCTAMDGFFKSLKTSSEFALQDTLRLITLWFDYGHQPCVSQTMKENMKNIKIDYWLEVIPQLIARIESPKPLVVGLIQELLIEIGKRHPQSLIYPIAVAVGNSDEINGLHTDSIINPAIDSESVLKKIFLNDDRIVENCRNNVNDGCDGKILNRCEEKTNLKDDNMKKENVEQHLNNINSKNNKNDRSRRVAPIITSLMDHSAKLVDQALLVSRELIRVSCLWIENWERGLHEAFECYRKDKDIPKMMSILHNLYSKMLSRPETLSECSFSQSFRHSLLSSYHMLVKFKSSGMKSFSDLNNAWFIMCKLNSNLSQIIKRIKTLDLSYVSPNLFNAADMELAIPGNYHPNKPVVRIQKVYSVLKILMSKQRPRQLTMIGDDGILYTFLLKANEDLRQDERVMQLFQLVNSLLAKEAETFKRNLSITHYSVIPLSTESGLIEWVADTDTLNNLIVGYRTLNSMKPNVEADRMKLICPHFMNADLLQKVHAFEQSLLVNPGCDLAKVLWLKSPSSEIWFLKRQTFSNSLATMSIVGFILGLGDRHLSNMMMKRKTGKIIHIDFGDCFDVAMHREHFPEKVPFRLTRQLVNALEVTGVDGTFRTTCEHVLTVLRENKDSLHAVLEAFMYDPLINWRLLDKKVELKAAAVPAVDPDAVNANELGNENNLNEQQRTAALRNVDYEVNIRMHDGLRKSLAHNKLSNYCTGSDNGSDCSDDETFGSLITQVNSLEIKNIVEGTDFDDYQKSEQLNAKGLEVIRHIRDKLSGRVSLTGGGIALDVSQHVKYLIKQATSSFNLAVAYAGWCPHL